MTFEELLSASASGLPVVECLEKVKGAESQIGQVVLLKNNRHWKGCAVQFPGLNYDIWFSDSDSTDKRSMYMRSLKLVIKQL